MRPAGEVVCPCHPCSAAQHVRSQLQGDQRAWGQVAHERPDLQEQAATLVRQLASYTITLTELEDNLLRRLAASQVISQAPILCSTCARHVLGGCKLTSWMAAHHDCSLRLPVWRAGRPGLQACGPAYPCGMAQDYVRPCCPAC